MKTLDDLKKIKDKILVIHYACTSTSISPVTVTAISIKNHSNKQATTYCTDDKITESDILSGFVEFLRQNQDSVMVVWNMQSTTYGFPHIAKRCKEHNIVTKLPIQQENIVDLDDVLEEKFGKKYISDPKLKSLAILNGINLLNFVDGKDEIILYENKDYRSLENSVNRKVSVIDDVLDLAFVDKLKIRSFATETPRPPTIMPSGKFQTARDLEEKIEQIRSGNKPKDEPSLIIKHRLKTSKLIWLPIGFTLFSIIMVFAIYYDLFALLDPQTILIHRSYVIAETAWSDKEKNTLLTVPYFFDMNGTLKVQTTSRSANNPMKVTIMMTPYGLEAPSSKTRWVEVLPDTLTFVFPSAKKSNEENAELPKQAEIIVHKNRSPLQYVGEDTILYENAGEYNFHLKERAQMQNGTKDEVTLNFNFDIKNDKSRIIMAELEAIGDEKIPIAPFSQTKDVEATKQGQMYTFIGVTITSALSTLAVPYIEKRRR